MKKFILSLLGILFIVFGTYKIVSAPHILLGAWTEGLFDSKTQELHPEKLKEFEQLVHKKVSIAHFYRGWEALSDPTLITQLQTLKNNGWTPMLNVNPYFFSECKFSNMPLYKAIAQGHCDVFLHQAGKNLSHVKTPFYLLFAWEMNNIDMEWSISKSGSSTDDFVAAWRHVHTIFKEEHASNIIWVFCPNIPDNPDSSYKNLYPGDQYVDWVGLDGYNWGTTQVWSHWQSFADVFSSPYNQIAQVAKDKPMLIAEVNATDQGGNKAAWYEDMFVEQLPKHFPKVKIVVIYNEDRTSREHVNWKIDQTPNTLQSFINGIHTDNY